MTKPAVSILPAELIRGTHIVLNGHPLRRFYYLESPRDGRAVFAMPWRGKVLVGTTECRYRGKPDAVRPLRQEIRYLCRIVKHYFAAWNHVSHEHVDSAFAGLRVLPCGEGHAFHRSREIRLHTDRPPAEGTPRLLTLYGGKLTVWRATAEKVMQRIVTALPQRKAKARTSELPLK
jgi:glycerol-3-phosphate dehydrogenase